MSFSIEIQDFAVEMLEDIQDRRIRRLLVNRIERLAYQPQDQGSPLVGALSGLRSYRAVGQRYRIIYRVDMERNTMVVVAVGIRREGSSSDIYAVAQRLARLGLL